MDVGQIEVLLKVLTTVGLPSLIINVLLVLIIHWYMTFYPRNVEYNEKIVSNLPKITECLDRITNCIDKIEDHNNNYVELYSVEKHKLDAIYKKVVGDLD